MPKIPPNLNLIDLNNTVSATSKYKCLNFVNFVPNFTYLGYCFDLQKKKAEHFLPIMGLSFLRADLILEITTFEFFYEAPNLL